ncbi:hypothetical protein [Methanonatronarchaeum sp. AMET-Sl]|uniref:hypothetical protein n=1 Tax=Methanonatronarchaeum sp. AMET-Sl TaxID=3037654 RepID=UPI00244E03D2|nr:hypothetical protein [Methanonatronarchaeum sp. AMET-Sl]WGI17908.1 hypothetical protein QEN48_02560 [Methanonatronarchaeum sp. AMET-Sl]
MAFFPLVFPVVIIYMGWFLHRHFSGEYCFRIFIFTFVVLVLVVLMTLVNLLYIVVRGGVLHEPFIAIINNASAGALLGLFIGYFYVQVLR